MSEREKFLCEMSDFWNAYERGPCDGPGGIEFRRVLGEWLLNDNESVELDTFIRARANAMPGDVMPWDRES